jgi:hypothetical protein
MKGQCSSKLTAEYHLRMTHVVLAVTTTRILSGVLMVLKITVGF